MKKHITSRSRVTKGNRYKIINWNEYNQSLKLRGSVNIWMNTKAIKQWYYQGKTQRGAQYVYSNMCIELCLMLRKIYHLPLRQTEGFVSSLMQSSGLKLSIPDYTILCRRSKTLKIDLGIENKMAKGETINIALDSTGLKVYGEGEWKVRQHGYSKYRTWRKLHIGIDPQTGIIHTQELTLNSNDDSALVETLIDQVESPIDKVLGDGIYDTRKAYDPLHKRNIKRIIPPRKSARITRKCDKDDSFYQRNEAIRYIRKHGKRKWKRKMGYHQRSKVETTMFRYKTTFGYKLQSREFERQKTEAKICCKILNQMIEIGKPIIIKN